jgi:Peptidase A4 family
MDDECSVAGLAVRVERASGRFRGCAGRRRAARARGRAGVLRWAGVPVVAGVLAVTGLAAGAGAQPALAADSLVTGFAWSGYVIYQGPGGPFYSVSAQFTVPTATCLPAQTGNYTAYWVGLQGSVGGIDQTGIIVSCVHGQPKYAGVHADLEGAPTDIPQPMQPGDQVNASTVCWFGLCTQMVEDVTQNWSDTSVVVPPAGFSGDVATAIAAESGNGGVNSTPVAVANAMVNSAPIGQFNPGSYEQNPAIFGNTVSIDPSPLDPTGTSFVFSWNGNPEAAVQGPVPATPATPASQVQPALPGQGSPVQAAQ